MPSSFAASITVLPWRTCTVLPSISRLHAGDVRRVAVEYVGRQRGSCLWSMWCWNSSRKCLTKLFTGSAAASPSAQIVRPAMLSDDRDQEIEVLVPALAVLDPVDDAPQPAGALAARRALAARLLEIEIRQAQQATSPCSACRP